MQEFEIGIEKSQATSWIKKKGSLKIKTQNKKVKIRFLLEI